MRSRRSARALVLAVSSLASAAACGNTNALPNPTEANVVDTVALYALDGTALSTPSAYAINGRLLMRTDQSTLFDFAFNFDSLGRPVFLPTGVLGLGQGSGFQSSGATFDGVTSAPRDGYTLDKPFVVATGNVLIARSRSLTCPQGTTEFLYAKLAILSISTTARTIRFAILSDQNCGYVGLALGLPGR